MLHDVDRLVEHLRRQCEVSLVQEGVGLIGEVEGHALEAGGVAAAPGQLEPLRAEGQPAIQVVAFDVEPPQRVEETVELELVAQLLAEHATFLEHPERRVVITQARPRHALGPETPGQHRHELRMLAGDLHALGGELERLQMSPVPVPCCP